MRDENRQDDPDDWCPELLALAGEDLLRRVGDDVDRGLNVVEYKGVFFAVVDDDKGWTYHYRGFSIRNLEEMLLYIEGDLRVALRDNNRAAQDRSQHDDQILGS